MARCMLAFLAAAVLCTAVLAQEVTPAHKGKHGYIDGYSTYDSSAQRYRPVRDAVHSTARGLAPTWQLLHVHASLTYR
jgi:opacity protein-like surface antigen